MLFRSPEIKEQRLRSRASLLSLSLSLPSLHCSLSLFHSLPVPSLHCPLSLQLDYLCVVLDSAHNYFNKSNTQCIRWAWPGTPPPPPPPPSPPPIAVPAPSCCAQPRRCVRGAARRVSLSALRSSAPCLARTPPASLARPLPRSHAPCLARTPPALLARAPPGRALIQLRQTALAAGGPRVRRRRGCGGGAAAARARRLLPPAWLRRRTQGPRAWGLSGGLRGYTGRGSGAGREGRAAAAASRRDGRGRCLRAARMRRDGGVPPAWMHGGGCIWMHGSPHGCLGAPASEARAAAC